MRKSGVRVEKPVYRRIYAAVRGIPPGHVATYGGIARHVGASTPRQIGYAMASLPAGSDVPWHRVINARGEVSCRKHSNGELLQRKLLEEEGVYFDLKGRVDLSQFGWLT
ncbi:MAG TPA: MGMT family protein [Gammaproteobacteria bacterium]|nr:MGMT family protein [Gammaproteobacteria bacterium]